jgi:hypothetical protein
MRLNNCIEINAYDSDSVPVRPKMPSSRDIRIEDDFLCGRGSSAGIATGYGLDGPGIESRWGRDFPHLSRPAMGPT